MEHMEWTVKAVPFGTAGEMLVGDWEPFAFSGGHVLVKKQVTIEGEKSSVGHELTFEERYEQ